LFKYRIGYIFNFHSSLSKYLFLLILLRYDVSGITCKDGNTYRLGSPHASEVAKLQKAQQQVNLCVRGGGGDAIPAELPELVARAQMLLASFKTHSPVSVLSVASVEVELSEKDISSVRTIQAMERGRSVRHRIMKDKLNHKSAVVIQSAARKRQQLVEMHRSQLLSAFTSGVYTGDFIQFIKLIPQCEKHLHVSDPILERSRQISSILLADAAVRWLGFTVPRSSKGSLSRFCDSDERSWKSLYWTPYVGNPQSHWLEEEFPFGFLVGQHPETFMERSEVIEDKAADELIILDPFFADSPRYSQVYMCNIFLFVCYLLIGTINTHLPSYPF
jgi:hypothetical protein